MKSIQLAVNGTLMRGLELNENMLQAGAEFVREDRSSADYRIYSIYDKHPAMHRVPSGGAEIALEIWNVPAEGLAQILEQEPPGLCIGKVGLADGSIVLGVLGEQHLCESGKDITEYGGWRAYVAERDSPPTRPD